MEPDEDKGLRQPVEEPLRKGGMMEISQQKKKNWGKTAELSGS